MKKKKTNIKRMIGAALIFAAVLSFFGVYMSLEPAIEQAAAIEAEALAEHIISSSVVSYFNYKGERYGDLVKIIYAPDGSVSLLETDAIMAATIKEELSQTILAAVTEIENAFVTVPLGSVMGNSFFSGKGPGIRVELRPKGSIKTELESEFVSAGINQTRHFIYAQVTLKLSMLLPVKTASATVKTKVCISDTIIVGKVPQAYLGGISGE